MGGSEEQKARWLPKLVSGEATGTLAVDEGPRHDPAKLATKVQNGALTGSKRFVYDAHGADVFIEAAMDGLYLVEPGHGVTPTTRRLADMRSHADVESNAAQTQKLSEGGEGLLDRVLDHARILTACEMLGMAQQVFDTTLSYLKQRVQFNQVPATFQTLQHRMANLFAELAQMRRAVEGGRRHSTGGLASNAPQPSPRQKQTAFCDW